MCGRRGRAARAARKATRDDVAVRGGDRAVGCERGGGETVSSG